ncbi:hypothetical protein D3C81_194590 [compost metagenome]|uniref:Uncharacterized protein n=1 Tax=Paenibacillus stellifer TaxID=169760 RepID=A0A089LKA4_9BACL|nr:hypothetical protein [Paenibacillus stellifer]AIQ61941.1 hypothetical protein PSTEL_01185 [Paenibacillus stellifer]
MDHPTIAEMLLEKERGELERLAGGYWKRCGAISIPKPLNRTPLSLLTIHMKKIGRLPFRKAR